MQSSFTSKVDWLSIFMKVFKLWSPLSIQAVLFYIRAKSKIYSVTGIFRNIFLYENNYFNHVPITLFFVFFLQTSFLSVSYHVLFLLSSRNNWFIWNCLLYSNFLMLGQQSRRSSSGVISYLCSVCKFKATMQAILLFLISQRWYCDMCNDSQVRNKCLSFWKFQ